MINLRMTIEELNLLDFMECKFTTIEDLESIEQSDLVLNITSNGGSQQYKDCVYFTLHTTLGEYDMYVKNIF